jgi:hypothetical protein
MNVKNLSSVQKSTEANKNKIHGWGVCRLFSLTYDTIPKSGLCRLRDAAGSRHSGYLMGSLLQ